MVEKNITRCRGHFGEGVIMILYGQFGAGSMPAPAKLFTKLFHLELLPSIHFCNMISILALIVPGERPRQEMTRKGSAGRTRSKFFPNGWTNQNQEKDLNQAINGQSEGSNQPRSSQSPKTRESRSEPANQNARINKSVPVTPDQTPILSPDSRPLTPDGPKNENEMLSSSLPSSFFHKSKY